MDADHVCLPLSGCKTAVTWRCWSFPAVLCAFYKISGLLRSLIVLTYSIVYPEALCFLRPLMPMISGIVAFNLLAVTARLGVGQYCNNYNRQLPKRRRSCIKPNTVGFQYLLPSESSSSTVHMLIWSFQKLKDPNIDHK